MDDTDRWNTILDKLRDALDDIRRDNSQDNAHAALGDTLRNLERPLRTYSDNPQRVHDDMARAHSRIRQLIQTNEVAGDEKVTELLDVLSENVLDIRGFVPGVLEAVEKRAALRMRQLPENERTILAMTTNAVVPWLEDARAAEDMRKGVDALSNADPNVDESRVLIYRWASRISRALQLPEIRTRILTSLTKETVVHIVNRLASFLFLGSD